MQLTFGFANAVHFAAIEKLVNAAYRPTGDTPAWTHESHWVTGARISQSQLTQAVNHSTIVLAWWETQLVACIQLELQGGMCHLGMFSVAPEWQNQGLGKQLLSYAEDYARNQLKASCLSMWVLSVRQDLLAFYSRRGYVNSGEAIAYLDCPEASTPKCDGLMLLHLTKDC